MCGRKESDLVKNKKYARKANKSFIGITIISRVQMCGFNIDAWQRLDSNWRTFSKVQIFEKKIK